MRRKHRKRKQKTVLIISILCIFGFLVTGYAAFSTNLTFKAKGNIKEKSRIIQSWSSTDTTDFHSGFYKENIVSATFVDNANVPSNAVENWNVSEDKKHGGVIAYVIPNNEDSTKYDLYIGAKDGVIANTNSSSLFEEFSGLKSINFNKNFDTSQTINMEKMFLNCVSLVNLDLSSFDTSNVISMYAMFCMWREPAGSLENNLISINFGENFNTSNVTNMRSMFAGLTKLQSLDLSGFNTSKVTTMYHMFFYLENITTLDLSNFDTSSVTDMTQLFWGCKNLKELNLCSFDTRNALGMGEMFYGTYSLTKVLVGPNWITTQADTSNLFAYSNISSVTIGQC